MVQLALLETAGGHQVVAIILPRAAEVLAGTEVLVCLRCGRLLAVAAVVAVMTPAAAEVVTTAAVVAVPIRSDPLALGSRLGPERVAGDVTKSLMR